MLREAVHAKVRCRFPARPASLPAGPLCHLCDDTGHLNTATAAEPFQKATPLPRVPPPLCMTLLPAKGRGAKPQSISAPLNGFAVAAMVQRVVRPTPLPLATVAVNAHASLPAFCWW